MTRHLELVVVALVQQIKIIKYGGGSNISPLLFIGGMPYDYDECKTIL
jgi:hypothetical protein